MLRWRLDDLSHAVTAATSDDDDVLLRRCAVVVDERQTIVDGESVR
jgi:hypothetical protein